MENPNALVMYAACDLSAYPQREVSFYSGKNKLSGYVFEADEPKGVVIIAHGFRADYTRHLPEAFTFVDNGYTVLCFDSTAVGESEGMWISGLQHTARDMEAAVSYVSESVDFAGLPIVLYGHSMGGYAAACEGDDERVSAIVSINGFDKPSGILLSYGKKYAGPIVYLEYPFAALYFLCTNAGDVFTSATDVLKDTQIPVMIIQAEEDTTVPRNETIYSNLNKLCNGNILFLWIDDEYRDAHSTVWLNADSAKKVLEDEGRHEGYAIPDTFDAAGLKALTDENFLGVIIKFFDGAVKAQ